MKLSIDDELIYLNKEVQETKEILSAVIERILENEKIKR